MAGLNNRGLGLDLRSLRLQNSILTFRFISYHAVPKDIHLSIILHLYVPDLIALSQTSRALQDVYFGEVWKTCRMANKSSYGLSLDTRPISQSSIIKRELTDFDHFIRSRIQKIVNDDLR